MQEIEEVKAQSGSKDTAAMTKLMEDSGISTAPEVPPPPRPVEPPPEPVREPVVDTSPQEKKPEELGGDVTLTQEKGQESPAVKQQPPPPAPNKEIDPRIREIDAIKLRPDASPKTSENFDLVKGHAHKAIEDNIALTTKVAELERQVKEVSSKVITPELEQEIEGLRHFRQTFGAEQDPNFNAEFDQAIKSIDNDALNLLQQWRILPQSAAKYIADNGGAAQFRYSRNLMPPQFKNKNGSPMTHMDYWNTYVAPALRPEQNEQLSDLMSEIRATARERDARIEDVKANKERYLQEAQANQKKIADDWKARSTAHLQKVIESFGDDAKAKPVPADAKPEVRAAIEKHNARIQAADAYSKRVAAEMFKSPETFVEVIMHAARSHALDEIIGELKTKLTKAESDLAERDATINKIKASATITHKTMPVGRKPEPAKPVPGQSAGQAMTALMNEAKV